MYQPGDTVHFRSLTLERFSLRPAAELLSIRYAITTPDNNSFELPQGDLRKLVERGSLDGAAVAGPDSKMLRGIGGGEWSIPPHFPGGEYVLTVREDNLRFPEQQRKFIVNKFIKPRLMKVLTWSNRTYGPGDVVSATCKVDTSSGPVARCPVPRYSAGSPR